LEIESIILIIGLSAIGGFLSGFLGIGGGVVFVPIISYVLSTMGVDGNDLVRYTLGNTFVVILFASSAATIRHIRNRNIQGKFIVYVAIGGVITSILTALFVNGSEAFSKFWFTVFFLCIAVAAFLRMLLSKQGEAERKPNEIAPGKYTLVGAFTGIISGLSGVGGGIVMVPAFNKLFKIPIKVAAGLSIGAICAFAFTNSLQYAILSVESSVFNLQWGYIGFDFVLYPALSVVIFAPLGVKASMKTKPETIRMVFLVFMLTIIIKTAFNLF
jgi:uncharacterized membrane protein YfcA